MMWLLYACGAAFCVALSAFWAKAGAKKGDSAPAAGIALFVTCLFAFFLAKEQIVGSHFTGIGVRTWIFILLSGIATAGVLLCFFQAIQMSEVIQVVPVQKCHLVLTMLVAIFVWHEKATVNRILAMILMVVGALIMILSACAKNAKWLLSAFGSAGLMCLSTFLEDYGVSGVGNGLLRFLRLLIALITIWIVVLTTGKGKWLRSLSFLDGIFLCLSGAATGVSWMLYSKSCALTTEHMVLAVYRLNLLMLVILATIFLKEKISGRILFGAILMIAGLELLLVKGSLLAMLS